MNAIRERIRFRDGMANMLKFGSYVCFVMLCVLLGHPQPVAAEVIDLATTSEAGGPYEIAFCARPSPEHFGFPGHAFVAFSKANGAGREFTALGLTVAPGTALALGALSYFNGVSGQLVEERFSHIRQSCLTVRVNSASYDRAYSSTRPVLDRLGIATAQGQLTETYRLSANDCITFAEHVAKLLEGDGLVVPARRSTDLPVGYIERLKESNSG